MRNLKKILALVLALVMSLSLMATASAKDFTDADQFEEKYKTAAEVLQGLGVLVGDPDGSFRPTGEITRAEVAAAVYRIVTGDVKDDQKGIYADYDMFRDVNPGDWYAGYVNFCANAEYIKGNADGSADGSVKPSFDPNGKVTGYAALAMILRAIGYTANGGFTGPEWEVQTARTAESRKITKNILTGTLGQPASRQTVAEILFQAILVNMVDHNQLNTLNGNQGYTETNETLGHKTFGLTQIQGVVTGNEFADLKSDQVLPAGQTQIETADGVRTLKWSSRITDIGESRIAYINDGTNPNYPAGTVQKLSDTGLNTVTGTDGAACEIETPTKFNKVAQMPAADDIEYYVNFGRVGTYTCDQRLEFNVVFYSAAAENSFRGYANEDVAVVAAVEAGWSVEVCANTAADPQVWTRLALIPADDNDYDNAIIRNGGYTGTNAYRFTKIVREGQPITDADLAILRGIFGAADNANNNVLARDRITGDVFVGTMSTNSPLTNEERDLSNQISYKKFFDEYINDETFNQNWNTSVNGDWVKFVDNDNDGKADYAFKTESWLDEAIDTYENKDKDTVTQFAWFNDDDTFWVDGRYTVRYLNADGTDAEGATAVGTKVIAAWIDNQILVEPAETNNVTVTDYNWRTDIINTDKGEYGQSWIDYADLGLQYFINTMEDKTEYVVYLDHFGYVRAYELPVASTYALVTEIYARNAQNGNLVMSWPMNVELWEGENGKNEYSLGGRDFVSATAWTQVSNYAAVGNYYNYLQPAVAHLGVNLNGYGAKAATGSIVEANQYTYWPANRQVVNQITGLTPVVNDTFDYGAHTYGGVANANTVSFTNVAIVTKNGDTAALQGAAKLRLTGAGNVAVRPGTDTNGNGYVDALGELPRYSVDYVQLTTAKTVAGQTRYNIDPAYTGWQGNAGNNYVSATHNTEYYIAYNGGVYYFTDYTKMIELAADNIHAAYAVAHDTSADDAGQPYWVADVIVYEIETLPGAIVKTSTALVYYNPSRNDQQVQRLNVLDSKDGFIDAIPPHAWNADLGYFNNFADYEGLGFYQFWNGAKDDNGDLQVGGLVFIDGYDHSTCPSAAACVHGVTDTCVPGADLRWNSNLIYAGTVINEVEVATEGTYINVDTNDDGNTNVSVLVKPSNESNVYSVTTDTEVGSRWQYNEATPLRYNNVQTSEIKAGDRIVWISAKDKVNVKTWNNTNNASFVVDLGNGINNEWIYGNTAAFLGVHPVPTLLVPNPAPIASTPGTHDGALWADIMNEQQAPAPAPTPATLTLTLGIAPAAVVAGEPETIADVFDTVSVNGTAMTKTAEGNFTCELAGETQMYTLTYTLAAGWTGTAKFASDDATFDEAGLVFMPKADLKNIVVCLDNTDGGLTYNAATAAAAALAAAQTAAKALIAEYVAAKVEAMPETTTAEADAKAIADANQAAIVTACASVEAAIDAATTVPAVDALLSKNADGEIVGTTTSTIDTQITAAVTAVTTDRETALNALLALVDGNEDAGQVLADNQIKLDEAKTQTAVAAAKTEIENLMAVAKTPDAEPVTPDDIMTGGDAADFGTGGDFEGMQNFLSTASSVVKGETGDSYVITVNFPVAKTYDKTSVGPFTGFGKDDVNDGADVLKAQGITGAAQDGVKFGFVAFQIEGSDLVVMVVGKGGDPALNTPYTSSTTLNVGGTDYDLTFNFQFTIA